MPSGFGTTPLSTTSLSANQFPVSAAFVPGTASGNLTAVEGILATTDGNGYVSTAIRMGLKDGDDVTQGLTTDAAVLGDIAGTISAKLRGLNKILNTLQFDGSNFLKVNVSAGTLTANIGTTNGLALDTSVNGVLLSQGSTTSGQKGPLLQGAVTTSVPSYTTAQTSPLSLTLTGALRIDGSAVTQPISGTITANQGGTWNVTTISGPVSLPTGAATAAKQPALGTAGSASSDVITIQGIASMIALKVDGSAVTQPVSGTFWQATQPVSGTVTANAGTNLNTSALALDTSVNGILLSQGSTTSGQKGALLQGAVTTNTPSYTTAQTSPMSLDTSGLLRISLKDTPANTNNLNVALASSSATVTVTATNLQTNVAQIGGTNVVTGGASGLLAVGGPVASGASNADNPLKVGGVFNTTQPTVTTGQVVDAQMTARGAQIVATGTDTFTVTVNAALPAGSSTIGAVTQASGPWTQNITQFGGNNVATGTGASGSGIPRVTVSNDSQIQLWDGTNGPTAVKTAQTSPVLLDKALTTAISPNNSGLPVNLPVVVQSTNNKSSGSVASLAKAFGSNNAAGNSIVVVCGVGNGTAPTISDTNSNTYTQAVQIANSTTLNIAIFYAVNITAGANTITVNNGGTTASIAMEIYEVSGFLTQVQAQPDQTLSNTGSSATASTNSLLPLFPNELAFAGIGVGTAAQTITVGSGWTNDSGQQNPTTPAGLFSFVSMSEFLSTQKAVTPQATFTSEPWAIAVASFKTVILPIEGVVIPRTGVAGGATPYHLISGASTNATNLKSSPGQVYGYTLSNTNASARYFRFYNLSGSPTVGTSTIVHMVQIPGNATVIRAFPNGLEFTTGIAFSCTGAAADADTTAISAGDVSFDLDYR